VFAANIFTKNSDHSICIKYNINVIPLGQLMAVKKQMLFDEIRLCYSVKNVHYDSTVVIMGTMHTRHTHTHVIINKRRHFRFKNNIEIEFR